MFVMAGFGAGGKRLSSGREAFGEWSAKDEAPIICVCKVVYSNGASKFIDFFFTLFFTKDRMGDAT